MVPQKCHHQYFSLNKYKDDKSQNNLITEKTSCKSVCWKYRPNTTGVNVCQLTEFASVVSPDMGQTDQYQVFGEQLSLTSNFAPQKTEANTPKLLSQ